MRILHFICVVKKYDERYGEGRRDKGKVGRHERKKGGTRWKERGMGEDTDDERKKREFGI